MKTSNITKALIAEAIAQRLAEGNRDKKGNWFRSFFDLEPHRYKQEKRKETAARHEEELAKRKEKEGKSFGLSMKTGKIIKPR